MYMYVYLLKLYRKEIKVYKAISYKIFRKEIRKNDKSTAYGTNARLSRAIILLKCFNTKVGYIKVFARQQQQRRRKQ